MKRFYLAYSNDTFWRQLVAKLTKVTSGQNILPQSEAKLNADEMSSKMLRQPVAESGEVAIWQQSVAKLEDGDAVQFLQHLVAEIPWGQNLLILNKLGNPAARLWYLRATARFGWSRNVLLNQIKTGAYERAVTDKKTHNLDLALPEYFAEQAEEMLKSSYNLEFLGLRSAVREREIEDANAQCKFPSAA